MPSQLAPGLKIHAISSRPPKNPKIHLENLEWHPQLQIIPYCVHG